MLKHWLRTKLKLSEYIIVVSGLPRSGTSMMMRMLNAGGLDIVADDIRKADDDNPHGYYELEKVKKIHEDSSFLENCYGKAVKIISLLLYNLPNDKQYKIIFMRRDLEEILASQKTMLLRRGNYERSDSKKDMKVIFEKHLAQIDSWIRQQDNIDCLYVNYNHMMANPLQHAHIINRFLENCLDAEKMAATVDTILYRERVSQSAQGHAH